MLPNAPSPWEMVGLDDLDLMMPMNDILLPISAAVIGDNFGRFARTIRISNGTTMSVEQVLSLFDGDRLPFLEELQLIDCVFKAAPDHGTHSRQFMEDFVARVPFNEGFPTRCMSVNELSNRIVPPLLKSLEFKFAHVIAYDPATPLRSEYRLETIALIMRDYVAKMKQLETFKLHGFLDSEVPPHPRADMSPVRTNPDFPQGLHVCMAAEIVAMLADIIDSRLRTTSNCKMVVVDFVPTSSVSHDPQYNLMATSVLRLFKSAGVKSLTLSSALAHDMFATICEVRFDRHLMVPCFLSKFGCVFSESCFEDQQTRVAVCETLVRFMLESTSVEYIQIEGLQYRQIRGLSDQHLFSRRLNFVERPAISSSELVSSRDSIILAPMCRVHPSK